MRFLHSMIRVKDVDATLKFFELLDVHLIQRKDMEQWQCSLLYLAAKDDATKAKATHAPLIELTYNWGKEEPYTNGDAFGHLAFEVDDIYNTCQKLMDAGHTINRPPRDGWMAFLKTPDGISIELLQKGSKKEPQEPWASMDNTGEW